ncbi:MAG: peroxiredoxin [Halothiobacillus sp. 24-54-40]|jgi:peroxiredoxin Q/BCP|nr:MAG: peroxiredoxin [Halothiobacillus sp. 20-53-49]OYY41412.1 MAG: peroxiredoxin [Halothiobacillus sp. 35-54-62]OYZ87866.1 MAG: peroxiredoxin [Halothiobacillus sp. 24-54-40]OZA80644.1 MAG: peroxiredoxin [Halothiobacillus sp. 39-53-45]
MIGSVRSLYFGWVLMLGLFFGANAQAAELQVGDAAPAFSLPDQAGKLHSLADYRGKWLVLYFYPKDETPGCTTEACQFRDDIATIQGLGVTVVGISEDSIASHERFAKKYHLPYTLLADDDGKVAADYDSLFSIFGLMKFAKRHTFIIDPQGRLAAIYTDVDPKDHSKQIIAALEKLLH